MEPSIFNTSWIRDKWHCWKSRTKSERRNLSSIATIRIGWKVVGLFYGMLLLSAKYPRPLGRRWNSSWKMFWWTIQRCNNSFWSNGWTSPDFSTRAIKTSSIWQTSLPGIFLGYALIAEWIWKGDILIADLEELENLDVSEIYPRRINAKEVLISQREEEFISSSRYSKIVRKRLRIPRTDS